MGIGRKTILGNVCLANSVKGLEERFTDGDIIVTQSTDKDMVKFIERSSGIIIEQGGLTSHGAIVGLNLGKPTIVGAKDATSLLDNGELITLDSTTGFVYKGAARVL